MQQTKIKIKMQSLRKYFLFFILIFLTGCGNNNDHIDADDMGAGKRIKLRVKADEGSDNLLKDETGRIVLKWTDTGLFLSDKMFDEDGNVIPPGIGLSVSGAWYPWGNSYDSQPNECELVKCSEVNDSRCQILADQSTNIVRKFYGNANCYLTSGLGIYVLVAKQQPDGSFPDPNQNVDVASGPSVASGFFTAHIGAFPPSNKGMINVTDMWGCKKINNLYSCDKMDINEVVGGKIYLKLMDQIYSDNDADNVDNQGNLYVLVNIKTGVYYPNFVNTVLKTLRYTIEIITKALKDSILQSFVDIIKLVLILYVAITGFGFMTGLVKLNQTEAVVRLLKIGIIVMLTTPKNPIANGFLSIYEALATFASDIIAKSMPNMPSGGISDGSEGAFGDQIGYLVIYDMILNQVISSQVQFKIWSLLFTKNFWLIPFLYILLLIILLVVFRSLLLYITAYVQISILILILPILAVMLLFKVTADLFQNWLKYMANSALLIVVATMGMGLTLSLMQKNLGDLLNYSITCHEFFWSMTWWTPDNEDAVDAVLNVSTYFSALIMALICQSFVEHVPKLADSLSDSQLSPSSHAFASLWNGISGIGMGIGSTLKVINANYGMGALLNLRYGKDGEEKEGKGVLDKWKAARGTVNSFFDSLSKPVNSFRQSLHDDSIIKLSDPAKSQELQQELQSLKEANKSQNFVEKDYSDKIKNMKQDLQNKLNAATNPADRIDFNNRMQELDKVEKEFDKIKRQ